MRITVTAALLGLSLLAAPRASACECGWYQKQGDQIVALPAPPLLSNEELSRYGEVFAGRVVSLALRQVPLRPNEFIEEVDVTIDVQERWKGAEARSVVLCTPASRPACGYPFELGESYLVFVDPPKLGALPRVELCSRTQVLRSASADREALVKLLGPSK